MRHFAYLAAGNALELINVIPCTVNANVIDLLTNPKLDYRIRKLSEVA